jgi:hypothetical protein
LKKHFFAIAVIFILIAFTTGCATTSFTYREPVYELPVEKWTVLKNLQIDPLIEEKVLALDPEHVSESDIRNVLEHAPAPRIINIHGGIYPVHLLMKTFSKFLIGMGYKEQKIRNPRDGSYSYSPYTSSKKLAGIIAWYYEKEGLRPMLIGHSQGGMQVVKVLHELAGTFRDQIPVYNPITEKEEDRYTIIDPLTGETRPVVGLKVTYATAVGAGGLTRFLPNQWVMMDKLRKIPDSVIDFTGFYMNFDIIGGDFLGFGSSNKYKANGTANVRNIKLPLGYEHVTIPRTKHLLEHKETRDWINSYVPEQKDKLSSTPHDNHILWAADVWYSIKKHWVIELQRLIKAKRKLSEWEPSQ